MENKSVLRRVISVFLAVIIAVSAMSIGVSAVLDFDDEYGDFLELLGYYESRNRYDIINEYGYMGRWQLGYLGLIDIGFMDNNYEYTELAASFGVHSDEDFMKTPDAQDYAVEKFHQKVWDYIEWYGDEEYVGKTFKGIKITVSGLVGACHLAGVGGVHEMLVTGEIATDANGSEATFYLKELAGFDISKSIGADIKDPVETPEEDVPVRTESTLYLHENYSGTNYMLGTDFSQSLDTSCIKSRNTNVYQLSIDRLNKYSGENTLKISGKSAGSSASKDMYFATDTNGNNSSDGYVGDSKTMTLSFYARASATGVEMQWRWGFATSSFATFSLTTSWKKYSVTFTKQPEYGSVLHPYFNKAANVNIAQLMLVDGSAAATLPTAESKTSAFQKVVGTIGSTYGTLGTPTRSGYTFNGWYTQKTGGEKITSSTKVKDGNIKAYAHWSKISSYKPVKSVEYNGHYYSVFDDTLSWSQARTACTRMGGHLVTIESKAENDAIKSLISSTKKGLYWIGCTDTSGEWTWVTGEKVSYENWAIGQPSGGSEHYAQIYSETYGTSLAGSWNDVNGTSPEISYWSVNNTGYICEFEPESISVSKTLYNDGSLYKVVNSQISWENAAYYAEKTGGHLVTINSSDESKYVNGIVSGGSVSSYWIGASDKSSEGKFKWVTGESFDFTNWDSSNPSNTNGIEHYVEISKSTLKWNDAKNTGRDSSNTGFIIEYDDYEPALQSVTVMRKPDKTNYVQGDELDLSGLVVRASYEFGIKEEIDDYKVSGYDKDKNGVQTLTVSYGGKTATFSIYVARKAVSVNGVEIDKTSVILNEGESVTLNATVYPENADVKTVIWSSDDSSIAKVSSSGVVTAVSAGTAVITATTKDGAYTARCVVNVERTKSLPRALLIYSKPKKTQYELNEEFDPTGMVIKVKYEDYTIEDVTDKVTISGFDSSVSAQQKVTVSYTEGGKTVSVPFTVIVGREVKNIYVTSKPYKTTYVMGETFEREGLKVIATFTDGITRDVTNSIRTSGFNSGQSGVHKMTVYYTYQGKTVTTTFSIIMNPRLNKITVTKKPTKHVYIMGELFNREGMVITATFSDGSTKDVAKHVKVSGFNTTQSGIQTITVTYTYATMTLSRTFSIVMQPKLRSIKLLSLPDKLEYNVGEEFDTTGMSVQATMSDGSVKDVSAKCVISDFDPNVRGEQSVKVTYNYGTVTAGRTFVVTVK